MKMKILAVLCTLAVAVTLSAATPAEIADAIAAKDHKLAVSLLEQYLAGKPGPVVHKWLGDLLYADFMASEVQDEQAFMRITHKRAAQYRYALLPARITLATRLNVADYYRLVFDYYNSKGSLKKVNAEKICDMKFHAEGDIHGAVAYAITQKLDTRLLVYLSYYTGEFSPGEMLAAYDAICRLATSPGVTPKAGQVMEWSSVTLVNLYTTGTITRDQFVSALKLLRKRVYLNLGKDRKAWEPVIASIQFGIEHADKLEQLGK